MVSEAVALLSRQRLALLHRVLEVMERGIEDSPSTRRLYQTCKQFYEFADLVLAEKAPAAAPATTQGLGDAPERADGLDSTVDWNEVTMSHAEWEDVMRDLEVQLGDGASGALAGNTDPFALDSDL